MKRTLLTAFVLAATCATSVSAADFDGVLTLGGSYANLHGQKAKANEYRALGTGAYGSLDLNYRDPLYFLDVDANLLMNEGKGLESNTAIDNNFIITGGMTDVAKLALFYNKIPHNLTYGARTYFNGVGTAALTSTLTGPIATTVFDKTFDYTLNRTNYGVETEMSFKSPFFFLVRAERTETFGLLPYNTAPTGTNLREIPALIDYSTDNFFMQTGYRSKNLIATVDGSISNFTNANNSIFIQQGATPTTSLYNTAYLPPDNKFYKVGGSVMYRAPIWNTTLMARGSHSIMASNPNIDEQTSTAAANGIPANTRTVLLWNGLIKYNSASASITSNPSKNFDTRIYYNFIERKNESDAIISPSYNGTGYNTPGQFGYHKQNAGVDLGYKLPAATKVSAGYDYAHTNRSSFWTSMAYTNGNPEALITVDHTVYLQVKNNLFDMVSGKLRYEHQVRSSEYPNMDQYLSTSQSGSFREFDAAHKTMDAIKGELEFEPMHGLDIGLQYAFKVNAYTNSPYGMQNDRRHEFYADATYAAGFAKFNVFGEVEAVEMNVANFAGNPTLAPVVGAVGAFSGYGATTNYYRLTNRKDFNYAVGGKVEADIIKNKLKASVGYRYDNAHGSEDFTFSTPLTQPVANTNTLDDYTRHTVNAKLVYSIDKNLSMDFGYLFEQLRYLDNAYSGYTNLPFARNATTGVYTYYALSGAYSNQDYDASVFYLGMKYKF